MGRESRRRSRARFPFLLDVRKIIEHDEMNNLPNSITLSIFLGFYMFEYIGENSSEGTARVQ